MPNSSSPTSSATLLIRNVGNIPSFKNSKMLCRGRLITDPKKQKVMQQIIRDLQSTLTSAFATIADGTATGPSLPCLTALCGHSTTFDDSHQWIPRLSVEASKCEAGEEGATITITLL